MNLSPEQWEFVTDIFSRALEVPPGPARAALLDEACHGQPAGIREEIDAMLRAENDSSGFLEFDAEPPPPLELPGGWRVLDKLGEGGMGSVYRVQRRTEDGFEQTAAAKLLSAFRGPLPELSRRLRAERRILAGLDHPNITRILDGGSLQGVPFYVMELVDGEPLLDYIKRHDLPVSSRLDLFQRICGAVQYAHQRLVVHRDIKPTNVMITRTGEPKLLDFGIAKVLEPEDASTSSGGGELTAPIYHAASVSYASPEQLRGQSVSTAADIYSLGALLYEMLTGQKRKLSAHSTPDSMAKEIEETPLPRASAVRPGISRDLDAIIEKATRGEPSARFASVEQLNRDIDRFRKGLPVEARQGAWRYVFGKFVSRNRWGVAAAVVLLGAFASYVVQTRRAEQQLRETREMAGLLAIQMPVRVAGPGDLETLRFRRKVANYGLSYLDDRLASNDWTPHQLALGYFKLANTLGAPEQISLGEFPRAAECYAKVIQLLWPLHPAEPELRSALYQSLLRLPRVYLRLRQAQLAKESAQDCESRAVSLQNKGAVGVRRLIAQCRFTYAMAVADLGEPRNEEAAAAALEILETLPLAEDHDIAAEPMSAAANRASAVSLRVRDYPRALRFAEMSLEAAENEAQGSENDLMRGVAHRNAATALAATGQTAAARTRLNSGIALLEELSKDQPDDVQSRAFLAQMLIERAALESDLQGKRRDLRRSQGVLREVIDGSRYPMARALMAQALADEATVLEKLQMRPAACDARRHALLELDSMTAERLSNPGEVAFAASLRAKACP